MVGIVRNWILKQLMVGEFRSYRDVGRKSVWVALKVSVLALILNLAAHLLLYSVGLLQYDFRAALILAIVLTPPITFILSVGAYLVVGFAIHDLGVSRAEFERLSRTDMLSGLANRRAFHQTFDSCTRDRMLAVFDIDRFKAINDTHGHITGDVTIASVAAVLVEVFPAPCLCARIGGEEFAVFAADMAADEFAVLAERARSRVERLRIGPSGFGITVSGGIARGPSGKSFGETFSLADKALYAAKFGGRNRIVDSALEEPAGPVPISVTLAVWPETVRAGFA
ncbi:GGDEF domain-containing protein [Hoeflea olei]|uniref:diguanylate cyclase n=1 Tax=Hoeflea olei TaxID=1480615 RepID=A0A1C1YYP0_9HYPH|nr:GGDEF domain-containing protein [Hoeflea olei]OCW58577.1 hypothetical protein AWJ14_05375 [Hoeflea olei]